MDNPLISVVVPVYKVEEYLNKCVDSIINQTYKNLEIILVDDGSPDNCPKICDEYAKKDNRIKVIHKTNGGLSDARNAGIKEARGQLIGFVDSDDYIDNRMYEYLYGLIKKYDADISNCGFRNFGIINEDSPVPKKEIVLNTSESLKMLAENTIVSNYAWNKLYKKELFINNNIEYPVGKIMEDIATTYKLFESADKLVVGTEIHYYYLKRENGITGEKGKKMLLYHIENIMERFEHFKDNKELGFYYFKNVFYVVMRSFLDYNDIADEYIDKNQIIEKIAQIGNKYGYFKQLALMDRLRFFLLKKNRKLYKNLMNIRRKIINLFKRIKAHKVD